MSTLVGKPVRVQLMRWDEHGWDQLGPAQVTDIPAGIDANGNIVGYELPVVPARLDVPSSRRSSSPASKLPLSAPTGTADTTSSASFYDKIPNRAVHEQEGQRLRRVPQGHLPARPGRAAVAVRLRADDRRARPRGEHGPDRVPAPEHDDRPERRSGRSAGQPLGRRARTPSRRRRTGSRRSRPRTSRAATSSPAAAFAIGGFSNARPAIVADITVNKKTGKITLHPSLLRAWTPAPRSTRPWSRTR